MGGDGKTDFIRIAATYAHTFISNGDGTFKAGTAKYPGGWNFGHNLAHWQTVVGQFVTVPAPKCQSKYAYERVAGAKYCNSPWTESGGNAAGSTAELCKELCTREGSCVAANFFPTWRKRCYLFTSCAKTARSAASGQVWMKRVTRARTFDLL